MSNFAAKLLHLLQGEPLRAINYGAVAVVYLVVKALVATGNLQDPPDFDGIVVAVASAIALATEVARQFVFSPNTVEAIVESLDQT